MPYLGEIAALGAAMLWSINSLIFGFAVRHLGSFSLNLIRLNLAALLLCGLAILTRGTDWIQATPARDLSLLALSGWIGLTLGDWAYYKSLQILGPRLATLLVSLVPPITTILGMLFLDEWPRWIGLLGMALTVGGVIWVVLERTPSHLPGSRLPLPAPADPSASLPSAGAAFSRRPGTTEYPFPGAGSFRRPGPELQGSHLRGVLFGVLGSLGQSVGLIVTKEALASGIATLPASAVRMTAGAAGIWLIWILARRPLGFGRLRSDWRVGLATFGGVTMGPVVGIWLSVVAVKYTLAGIAATLTSTMPVLILPLVIFVQNERVSPRAALGAILAVAGVALLFARI